MVSFDYCPSLEPYIAEADVVIGHAGRFSAFSITHRCWYDSGDSSKAEEADCGRERDTDGKPST